ncbi:hypothetical protein QC763_401174 [Podospora pseudopauciseta]|uniref:Uncharacterized protein n=1 Tax=Podospora pseudopauciseta TaxID=2093780 RepID=A0ABR0HBB9_9PEZI|nr:hypothetical protein QC763_401174 [Podospora pseudopauciseta]
MKFTLAAAAFAFLANAADAATAKITTSWIVNAGLLPVTTCYYHGEDGKTYFMGDFSDGCRGTKHDWVRQICVDSSKARAHITFSGGTRRCFKRTWRSSECVGTGPESCYKGICPTCSRAEYTPTSCTW